MEDSDLCVWRGWGMIRAVWFGVQKKTEQVDGGQGDQGGDCPRGPEER